MAIIKLGEMREMDSRTLEERLADLRRELNSELGAVASGGRATNPGRIRELRRTIARILTILKERASSVAAVVAEKVEKTAEKAEKT
ncbi:MAG: 50S ribosomal protein L29 [Candidatus Micrarchaeota archaeon]